jgi:hypothetical protein
MVAVYVAFGLMAFLSASMLAIDVGMLMSARAQAQNSADSGALAGAVALVFEDFNDRTATGPAVQNAVVTARSNAVMHDTVSVDPADVTFPTVERIRVRVQRTAARGNELSTIVARYFGMPTADIAAVATAEAVPANAATCIKPWAIPDKWIEMQTPVWDTSDQSNMFYENGPNKGLPLPNPDIYRPVDHPNYTGYQQSPTGVDYGLQVVLKPGNPGTAINPGQYFPIALDGGGGAAWYEDNIPGCWPGEALLGNLMAVEPGNMTGPTKSGTADLTAKDPNAYWDTVQRRVVSSMHPSPRIVVLPVFDTYVYELGRQTGRIDIKIANFVGFFIEDLVGNDVRARIVPAMGLIRPNGGGGGVPSGAFLRAIRLVE